MLVLAIKNGETFYIGENKVVLLGFQNGKVRVGVDAPREVPVDRGVVRDRKIKESRSCSTATNAA